MITETQAWDVLHAVPDPEIPVISVTELGIVREVLVREGGLHVVVTPTIPAAPRPRSSRRASTTRWSPPVPAT